MALQILMSDKTLVAKRGRFESVMDFYVGGNLPPMEYHDVIEGCRQIYPEEWQIMVLQDKLKLKKESK